MTTPALIQKVLMTTTAVTEVVTVLLTCMIRMDGEPLPGSVAPYERAVNGYRFEPTVTDSESDANDVDRRANDTGDPLVPKQLDNTADFNVRKLAKHK